MRRRQEMLVSRFQIIYQYPNSAMQYYRTSRHWGNSFTRTACSIATATLAAAAKAASSVSFANNTSGFLSSVVTLNPYPTPLGMLTSMTSLIFHMLLLLLWAVDYGLQSSCPSR